VTRRQQQLQPEAWRRILSYQHASGNQLDRYVLCCTGPDLREQAVPEGAELITVRAGSPAADIAESLTINEQGFDPSAAAATAAQAEAFRSNLAGGAAVTVRLDGAGTSGGMYTPVRDGVTELVGIATLAPYRRRGLAGLVVATLAGLAFSSGADLLFLTTGDDHARGAYRRAGFADVDGPQPAADRLCPPGSAAAQAGAACCPDPAG
jgi:GNAT superfamily N-acetyltransferase